MLETWVQDVPKQDGKRWCERYYAVEWKPESCKYVIGPPKSGKPDEVGIYFQDPKGEGRNSW